jgi:serine/threonine-protein kinase HipA
LREKRISGDPLNESWSLAYTADWRSDRQAIALSPALQLHAECSSASIRRFIENLLPEGRALDIVASAQGVAKSNVYGLIRALGAETTGAFRFLPQGEDGTVEPAKVQCVKSRCGNWTSASANGNPVPWWNGMAKSGCR